MLGIARDCYCAPHSEDAEELQCKAGGAPMGLPGSCFAYRGYADLVFLCTIPLESGGFVTDNVLGATFGQGIARVLSDPQVSL